MVKRDWKSEGKVRKMHKKLKSECLKEIEIEARVSEIGSGLEKKGVLGLKFLEKYVKGSVNRKNIKFV